ncbi:uncharacterized protein LOC133265244 isoform X2 [Pezoporus flaviventris]|uniref:uncharacterized protein LOC133265244 isoform X2 n=1 Tax=Pezoporus flaviventris TaxID=889875 RepID=UPI002AB0398D|nr:uncharacterized protein LOC133265244 isoform X2 [Pezoporus flaviventris]
MADELCDLLREFDEVMEGFDRGPARQYEQHLEELKRKAGTRVYDSGIDELETGAEQMGQERGWTRAVCHAHDQSLPLQLYYKVPVAVAGD